MNRHTKLLVISGTMGSGKTTVLSEASDILTAAGTPYAAIDLDTLGIAYVADGRLDDLIFRNLSSVWSNFRTAGVTRLLLAAAIESMAELDRIREAVPAAEMAICRLTVDINIAEERVRTREPGMLQEKLAARVRELDEILDAAKLQDFSIQNTGTSVTVVAREMLTRAGWL